MTAEHTHHEDGLILLTDVSAYVHRCGTPHMESWRRLYSAGSLSPEAVVLFLACLELTRAHIHFCVHRKRVDLPQPGVWCSRPSHVPQNHIAFHLHLLLTDM